LAKLSAMYRLFPELFPCPPQKLVKKLHMLSDMFIFVKIPQLQFLPKFWILWQNFERFKTVRAKIFAKLSLKFWLNFRCRNITSDTFECRSGWTFNNQLPYHKDCSQAPSLPLLLKQSSSTAFLQTLPSLYGLQTAGQPSYPTFSIEVVKYCRFV